MTKTNRSNEVDEIYPESRQEIDYLLGSAKTQARVQNGENKERKPIFTPGRKAVLGGLAGIAAGVALGPLAIIPLGVAGAYAGAVGVGNGIRDTVQAGWAVTKALGKGALMAGAIYADVKNQLNSGENREPIARAERYGTNEEREHFANLDAGMLREEERLSPEYISSLETYEKELGDFFDKVEYDRKTNERLANIGIAEDKNLEKIKNISNKVKNATSFKWGREERKDYDDKGKVAKIADLRETSEVKKYESAAEDARYLSEVHDKIDELYLREARRNYVLKTDRCISAMRMIDDKLSIAERPEEYFSPAILDEARAWAKR